VFTRGKYDPGNRRSRDVDCDTCHTRGITRIPRRLLWASRIVLTERGRRVRHQRWRQYCYTVAAVGEIRVTSWYGGPLISATGCFISFDEGVRMCACFRHHPGAVFDTWTHDACLRFALSCELWRSCQVVARWSLPVASVLLTAALSRRPCRHRCAMSARDVWGFSCIGYWCFGSLMRQSHSYARHVRAALSSELRRSCQVLTRWSLRVLLAAALSCRPCHASLRHVGLRCLGFQLYWVLCVLILLSLQGC
jgi:hypothetical protein